MDKDKTTIGDFCTSQNGYAFKSDTFKSDGDFKVIKIKEIKNGTVLFSKETAEVDTFDDFEKYTACKGDVLFALTGDPVSKPNPLSWVGRVSIYNHDFPSYINQRVGKIICGDKISNKFLYYFFRQYPVFRELAGKAKGSASQANISTKDILDTPIDLPSLDIQKKIVKVLSLLDDKIETNRRIISKLYSICSHTYNNWFVCFEPYKNCNFVESEIGSIPEGWEYKPILENEIFSLCKSKVKPFKGEKKYYATANVDGHELCGTPDMVTFENRPSRAGIVPCKNSIWFARMSKSYKILNCYGASNWLSDDAIISTGFCGITTNNDYYGFVYTYLISETFDKLKDTYATGTTQISLTNQGLEKIKVLLPPKSEIQKFSKFVAPIIEEIESCKYENMKLTETRDNLLPRLMSGEINIDKVILDYE